MKTEKVTEKVPVTKKLKIRVNNLLERMSSLEAQVEACKEEVRKVRDENRRLETIVLDCKCSKQYDYKIWCISDF